LVSFRVRSTLTLTARGPCEHTLSTKEVI